MQSDAAAGITVWSAETDTFPRVIPGTAEGTVGVALPVGVWSGLREPVEVEVEITMAGATRVLRTGRDEDLHAISPEYLEGIRAAGSLETWHPRPVGLDDRARWHLEMAREVYARAGNQYAEAVLPEVPLGAWLEYQCRALVDGVPVAATCRFGFHVTAPVFGAQDLRAAHTPGGEGWSDREDGTWWVLFQRQDADFDHIRVDLLAPSDSGNTRPDLVVDVAGQQMDVGGPRPSAGAGAVWIPLVDLCADTVTFSIPRGAGRSAMTAVGGSGGSHRLPPVQVTRGGVQSGPLDAYPKPRPARIMLINYAIQGLNDLFELPEDKRAPDRPVSLYDPPRTYAQITVRDERGAYSSRPVREENGEPDGYAYALVAQREFGIRTHWAFNAGLLLLLAHDCPEDLLGIRRDVESGLIRASNAGYGAHRPPYYQARSNIAELARGAETVQALLGRCDGVYYPDQRLYKSEPRREVAAYAAYARETPHPGPFYLVLDRSTLCHERHENGAGAPQERFFPDATSGTGWTAERFGAGNRLWRDAASGYRLLLIEDDLRNGLFEQSDDELRHGKLALRLRRMFMKALNDVAAQPSLFVYADDADKPAGAGWFDVTTDRSGRPFSFTNRYQSALAWLARHPWVRVVTTEDLDNDPGSLQDLPVASATCPSVDPGGATEPDACGRLLHFDTWYEYWKGTCSPWLGRTLGQLLDTVEGGLLAVAGDEVDPDLYGQAWASFLLNTHEQFWNTQPVERDPNQDSRFWPPEDFVIAESLQMRNALVYLNAARWAQAARDEPDEWTHVDEGWLLRLVPDRHWDADLLPNVLMYNRQVLLVIDRNGGCITHIFVRRAGRAFCVSGTPKAYQWFGPVDLGHLRDPAHTEVATYNCDGAVLQNTVWTPNHAYVAADSALARPRLGSKEDPRAAGGAQDWLYPNNFDEYDGAISGSDAFAFTYQAGTEAPPARLEMDTFMHACKRDRLARATGIGERVVWHDAAHVGFRKIIRLSGRSVSVSYEGVRPGHVVANEFCVHLAASLRGQFHRKEAAADQRSAHLSGPDGVSVRLGSLDNCAFTPAALLSRPAADPLVEMDRLRLHRVLTDNLELCCPAGGQFSYRIDL